MKDNVHLGKGELRDPSRNCTNSNASTFWHCISRNHLEEPSYRQHKGTFLFEESEKSLAKHNFRIVKYHWRKEKPSNVCLFTMPVLTRKIEKSCIHFFLLLRYLNYYRFCKCSPTVSPLGLGHSDRNLKAEIFLKFYIWLTLPLQLSDLNSTTFLGVQCLLLLSDISQKWTDMHPLKPTALLRACLEMWVYNNCFSWIIASSPHNS